MNGLTPINNKLFQPSVWDDIPMKRDNLLDSQIIQPEWHMQLPSTIKLPKGYRFRKLEVTNRGDASQLAQFLNQHSSSLVQYYPEYISYLLGGPKKRFKDMKTISISIQDSKKKIIGCIIGEPVEWICNGNPVLSLKCWNVTSHQKYRGKRIAVALMKRLYSELRTHENENGTIFFAPNNLPFQPLTESSKLLYRNLTPKVNEINENDHHYHRQQAVQEQLSLLKQATDAVQIKKINEKIAEIRSDLVLPTKDIHNLRLANKRDISALMEIYSTRSKKHKIYEMLTRKQFEYRFLPRRGLIYTYVLTNSQGEVKDFVCIVKCASQKGQLIAYIRYLTFFSEEVLKIFLQNVLFVIYQSLGIDVVIAHEYLGCDHILRTIFKFEDYPHTTKFGGAWFALNYTAKTISKKDCGLMIDL